MYFSRSYKITTRNFLDLRTWHIRNSRVVTFSILYTWTIYRRNLRTYQISLIHTAICLAISSRREIAKSSNIKIIILYSIHRSVNRSEVSDDSNKDSEKLFSSTIGIKYLHICLRNHSVYRINEKNHRSISPSDSVILFFVQWYHITIKCEESVDRYFHHWVEKKFDVISHDPLHYTEIYESRARNIRANSWIVSLRKVTVQITEQRQSRRWRQMSSWLEKEQGSRKLKTPTSRASLVRGEARNTRQMMSERLQTATHEVDVEDEKNEAPTNAASRADLWQNTLQSSALHGTDTKERIITKRVKEVSDKT